MPPRATDCGISAKLLANSLRSAATADWSAKSGKIGLIGKLAPDLPAFATQFIELFRRWLQWMRMGRTRRSAWLRRGSTYHFVHPGMGR